MVDAQLPPALVRFLTSAGYQADHVNNLGLACAADRDIWRWAIDHHAVIVTKDEDFLTLRALRPDGPTIVWIRIGNTTRDVLGAMSSALPHIGAAIARGEAVIEVTAG